ncbi:MAG: hypothetical protein LCH38_03345 [Proteobacteria bacterium]|nr:hypothetical protein [Pseudomonadota bacterium]
MAHVNRLSTMQGQTAGTRIQRVTTGVFVLRYSASSAGVRAPSVTIMADAGVSVLSDPPSMNPVLRAPGDAVVVHALRDSYLQLLVEPASPNASQDAQLTLERISCSLDARAFAARENHLPASVAPLVQPAQAALSSPTVGPSILAHVSRRGDVSVAAGEWVCGPAAPLPIEGIEIVWPNRPVGIEILTSVAINLRGRQMQQPVGIGQFAGSRQKAAPIVGMTFNLSGAAAHRHALSVDAIFLGGAVVSKSGHYLEFAGNSGTEPLVGLRLSLVDMEAALPVPQTASLAALPNVIQPMAAEPSRALQPIAAEAQRAPALSNRVRIFRMPKQNSGLSANLD